MSWVKNKGVTGKCLFCEGIVLIDTQYKEYIAKTKKKDVIQKLISDNAICHGCLTYLR